jgi:hypothetical protein
MAVWRGLKMPRLAAFAAALVVAFPAIAQEVRDYGTSSRGLVRDGTAVAEASALLARASVTCSVTDARLRGRDSAGNPQYEVACAEGPGFLLVSHPAVAAISCLVLEGRRSTRAPGCRLPANRNTREHYRRMAAGAGVACEVDRGRHVGHTVTGGDIYEIGCEGLAGGWLVRSATGDSFRSCLVVEAEGGDCALTGPDERLATAAQLLRGSSVETCAPVQARYMGASAGIQHYEIRCRAGDHVVARLPREGGPPDIVPCEAATLIGGGCRFAP